MKAGRAFDEFVEEVERRAKIEQFLEVSGYKDKVAQLDDLRNYCHTQYAMITALCRLNREYLQRAIGVHDVVPTPQEPRIAWNPESKGIQQTLPIDLDRLRPEFRGKVLA